MIKLLLLAISVIGLVYGQEVSEVTNVKVSPKLQSESTAVIFIWDAPSKLGSNATTDLKYTVKYCDINTPNCKESGKITERRYEATGLKKNFLYNYAITAFGKDDILGKKIESVFRTQEKDTCSESQFTCVASAGCINPVKKCDGIVNCRDASDEGVPAGCTAPTTKPKNIEITDVEKTSFVVKYQQVTPSDRATVYDIEILNTVTGQKTSRSDDHNNFGAPTRSKTVSGLQAGVEYKIRIRAINRAGAGVWSDEISVRTKGIPFKVGNVKAKPKVNQESTAFTLTWDVPVELDGNTIADLKYQVTYCQINRIDTCKNTPLSNNRKVEITGLEKNFIYSYTITTYVKDNKTASNFEQIYRTKATDTCLDSQFTCVASAGCIDPVKKCDGIVNCRDASDEGVPAGCTVPTTKPKIIEITDVEKTSFVIKYQQVTASDRATVYDIEILNIATGQKTSRSDDHNNFGAPTRSKIVSGLQADVEYKIRIRAINRAGAGVWSDEVSVRTKGIPFKVGNVKAKPKVNQESTAFTLTWDVPVELDGNTIADLKYQVTYCQINRIDMCRNTPLSNNRKVEITGLKKNFIYSYTITTYVKDNKTASNFEQIYRTKATDTCQPTKYTCVKSLDCIDPTRKCDGIVNCRDGSDEDGNAGCTLPLQKPADLTVEDIKEESFVVKYKKVEPKERAIGYEIEIVISKTKEIIIKRDGHSNFGSPIRSVAVSGLTEGTEYKIRVRALNRVGAGQWTEFKTVKTNARSVGQEISEVTNVKVTPKAKAESTAVIFTWDAPSKLGSNAAIDLKYNVKYCEINTPNCKESGKITERRYEATGLKKNFLYNYAITAFGKDDIIGKKAESVFRTQAKDTCSDSQFTCVASAGCIDPVRKCDGIVNCRDASDEGVPAGCTVPANKPGNILITDVKETSFVVKYRQVTMSDRATGYEIEILNTVTGQKTTKSDDHSKFGLLVRSKTVSDLQARVEYKIRIRAVNRAGAGIWSDEVSVRTKGVLITLDNVKAEPKTNQESTAFTLTWDIPAELDRNIVADLKYQVTYCQINRIDTCKNTTLSNNRKVEITGLEKNFIYSYTITTFDKDNKAVSNFEQIYRTKATDTCQPTEYTCVKSLGCVDPRRKCDGIVNCRDGSDEDGNAGCTVPSFKPKEILIKSVESDSFVIKFEQVAPQDRATDYEIEIRNTIKGTVIKKVQSHNPYGTSVQTVSILSLDGATEYLVRIRAVNRVGNGPWSDEVKSTTKDNTNDIIELENFFFTL